MTLAEHYRQVFNAPSGKDVLADMAAQVERLGGSAGQLLGHITRQLHQPDPPARKPKPDRMKASGGRILHG